MTGSPNNLDGTPSDDKIIVQDGVFTGKIQSSTRGLITSIIDGENPEITEIQVGVYKRVYLMRHYPYVEDNNYQEYIKLLAKKVNGERMSEFEKIELLEREENLKYYEAIENIPNLELRKTLEILIEKTGKTLVVFDRINAPERVKATARNLTLTKNKDVEEYIHAPGSNKNSSYVENFLNIHSNLSAVIEGAYDKDYGTIIIVSNRSYAPSFQMHHHGVDTNLRESIETFEKNGYLSLDYNSDGEVIAYDNSMLRIEPLNYSAFQELFPDINSKTCQEFQNLLVNEFSQNHSLFSHYLTHPSSPVSLRTFCLANLIHSDAPENKKTLQSYIHGFKIKKSPLPFELLEIFLKEKKKIALTKEALLVSLLCEKNIGEIRSFCETRKCPELYKEISILADILKLSDSHAQDIFRNSLDDLIRHADSEPELIHRGMYGFRRKPEADIEQLRKEKGSISKDEEYERSPIYLSTILSTSKKPFVLLGHVGDGKSTELAKMKHIIDTDKEYADFVPLFYSAKTDNNDPIRKMARDIKSISDTFPDKKIVIFFDGIDEFDGTTRIQVVDYLNTINTDCREDKWIRVIMGSRPSGFDELSENNVHFKSIGNDDKMNFLKSRLRSLGVLENNIPNKLEEIEKFLVKNILAEDLKNTPLILFFLCKLSIDEKLNGIKNRSSLYEEIVKKIIIDHNISKGHTHTGDYIDEDLDKLSAVAFDIYNNRAISLSDTRAQKLAILFKQIGKKEYGFIHKSFEEFFLARYLAKDPNGAIEIYKKRDNSMMGNWNNWREFRPIVMFYGEMLINKQEWGKLAQFLGENELLKNDDIFGRNFFMGLEILYKLPEEIKNGEYFRGILKRYEKKVEKWGFKEIMEHFEEIKKFMGNTRYIKTNMIVRLGYEVLRPNPQDINSIYKASLVLSLFGNTGISMVIEGAKKILDQRNFYGAGGIYTKLVENGSIEGIKSAIEGAGILVLSDEFQSAGEIYIALIKKNIVEAIDGALDYANKLFDEEDFYEVGEIHVALAESSMPKAIKSALEGMQKLFDNGNSGEGEKIYSALMKNNSPEAINGLNKWTPQTITNERENQVNIILSTLLTTITSETIMKVMEYGVSLLNEGKYEDAQYVYTTLAENNSSEIINSALEGARMFFDRKKYLWAWDVYSTLIKNGIPEAVDGAQECAKALFDIGEVDASGRIYTSLGKNSSHKAINIALRGAKMLFDRKKYNIAGKIYISLIKNGIPEAVDGAQECAKALVNKQRPNFFDVGHIYTAIAENSSPKTIDIVLEGAKMLFDKKQYEIAGKIYLALESHGISGARACADELYKEGHHEKVLYIYSELFKLPAYISQDARS